MSAVLLGGLTTLGIHEAGHIVVAESQNVDFEYDGLTIIYPNSDLSDTERLRIASAGFQAQWIAAEFALRMRNQREETSRFSNDYLKGVVLGNSVITLAYLTILKNHEDGDVEGMAQATGLSNNEIALLIAIPAALDTWRLLGKNVPKWVPNVSAATKGLGLAAIWTF